VGPIRPGIGPELNSRWEPERFSATHRLPIRQVETIEGVIMNTRITLAAAAAAVALLALAGCSSSGSSDTSASGGGSSSSSSSAPSSSAGSDASGAAEISTANSSLGEIVVDGQGMTAYFFDNDAADSGTSSCTGDCAKLWPAIESATTTPVVDGVSGTIATIKGVDGGNQITIDGRPIYTFANDKKPGDVAGQGVGGIWFAVSPAGEELTSATPAASGASTGY
jgi:predicted lipoprotein with Yx(FWY)xxD motif